ncbi:origin recognition complex subunit 3 N-terminus-domain-containing protein [Cadophora sp. MPI-SDFR-AT-0126]|nr:origin recognition complex subunit 3 N-terminus-domain-containing protein [Leotiomycetes sp. MPI-SDFR-AT-0126]
MSELDEHDDSHKGFDTTDHQAKISTAYVYTPANAGNEPLPRPAKRRKVANTKGSVVNSVKAKPFSFEPLLDGFEAPECADIRKCLFERSWSATDARIQSILNEANEDTLTEVTAFIGDSGLLRDLDKVPTGFVVTGPNITSQGLLFNQLSTHLRSKVVGPVAVLRSGDASNLKAVLKQLIRDATNQQPSEDDEEDLSSQRDGHKLLNYDLEILHGFVEVHQSQAVVVAFQDSEAFDTSLVADLISLFSSWKDRIPFVLLFGIATSVDLFHERLSQAASRSLEGRQFDVEQTSSLLERIFEKAVSGGEASLRLGSKLVAELIERQEDHVQSVQSFVGALKYSYMCHFYGNPLSLLNDASSGPSLSKLLQPQHFELIRMLPSFKKMTEGLVEAGELLQARDILRDDEALLSKVRACLDSRHADIARNLRAMHLAAACSPDPVAKIELYMTTFQGDLGKSELLSSILDSIKRMAPEDLIEFIRVAREAIIGGALSMDLDGWADDDAGFLEELSRIQSQASSLLQESEKNRKPVRSSYAIHSKGVRTTVIAQRVQLSYEKSTLSEQDKEFTALVDHLSQILAEYFTVENPQDMFLNEVWLFNSTTPYRDYFTPRPRAVIERALSAPYDYLNCECCEPLEGLSSTHPATAILYQMSLETGSLINIFDLWLAFFEMVGGGDEQKVHERDALALFYRALADLKSLGMVKQSKKKADHLAKVAWKGL